MKTDRLSEAHGCPVAVSRFEGPLAKELFIGSQPPADTACAQAQAEAMYQTIADILEAEGGSLSSIVCETAFLRSATEDRAPLHAARQRVRAARGEPCHEPAVTDIEQPPLNEQSRVELLVQAIVPTTGPARRQAIRGDGADFGPVSGLRLDLGNESRFYASGLCGSGTTADEQALAMFGAADHLLRRAGADFGDVVRTWIYFRDIDRDYSALNRARRVFFDTHGIDPVPASTGIGGGPVPDGHDMCLGLYAVRAAHGPHRSVMTSPTLNEAPDYGADFVRGMRVDEANRIALCVSGTASIDEAGRTAHPGDFDAQADRMLLNIRSLLEGEGAGFADIVSAITYVKRPEDAARLRAKLQTSGFQGFPNVLVSADICRSELLCEAEVLAVLPPRGT